MFPVGFAVADQSFNRTTIVRQWNLICKQLCEAVDIRYFLEALKFLRHVGFGCSFFDTKVIAEKVEGLKSILTFECSVCNKIDTVRTSHTESSFGSTNRVGVIDALSTGIGYTQFAEILALTDIPQLCEKTYSIYHNSISNTVSNLNQRLMSKAAEEEANSSEEKN
ncbi:hypothetical protein RN001_001824 [Aquatica leii]|uniref:Mutator-like transposase domain-containing protein n=1 Tax=Aquatica leii TaxID=1421715 RepID=A0AAN7SR14_9COLE|nr:hypothetical protein RN001_001824 [Aquatica leii]